MTNNYFPDIVAKAMSKIDTKTQLEASMWSMTLILCGMILTGIYMTIYTGFALWYKIVIVINVLAGIVFMASFLITTFQTYQSHCEILDFQKELKPVKGGKNAKD